MAKAKTMQPATLQNITRAYEAKVMEEDYDVDFGALDSVSEDFDWWQLSNEAQDALVYDLLEWFNKNEKRLAREQARIMRDKWEEARLERKCPDNY